MPFVGQKTHKFGPQLLLYANPEMRLRLYSKRTQQQISRRRLWEQLNMSSRRRRQTGKNSVTLV